MSDSRQREWQRRAHGVLGELVALGEREKLPPVDWTIVSAGAAVVGRCCQPDMFTRRRAFMAWAHALEAQVSCAFESNGTERLATVEVRPDGLVRVVVRAAILPD